MRNAAICLVLLITVALASCAEEVQSPVGPKNLTLAAPAQAFTDNFTETFTVIVGPDGTEGCLEEEVELQVVVHVLTHLTENGNHFTFKQHGNEAGTSGVGLTTGTKYHGASAINVTQTGSFSNGQFSQPLAASQLLVGQGTTNNFILKFKLHFTVNANGEVTADFDSFTIECK